MEEIVTIRTTGRQGCWGTRGRERETGQGRGQPVPRGRCPGAPRTLGTAGNRLARTRPADRPFPSVHRGDASRDDKDTVSLLGLVSRAPTVTPKTAPGSVLARGADEEKRGSHQTAGERGARQVRPVKRHLRVSALRPRLTGLTRGKHRPPSRAPSPAPGPGHDTPGWALARSRSAAFQPDMGAPGSWG